MTQPTLLEMAEEIERLTEGRIPLDRASWIALYIQWPAAAEDELLEAAAEAQTAYWNALHDLEEATGLDIDSTQDLAGKTVADLTEN